MTYDPNHDRTYWRSEHDDRLIEAARDSGHELAIALGERLDDYRDIVDELESLKEQHDELKRRTEALAIELRAYEDAIHDTNA